MSRLVHEAGGKAACLAMWSGEDEFKPLLEKALLKPSKSSLAAVTDIAVRDEKWVRTMPTHPGLHAYSPLVNET